MSSSSNDPLGRAFSDSIISSVRLGNRLHESLAEQGARALGRRRYTGSRKATVMLSSSTGGSAGLQLADGTPVLRSSGGASRPHRIGFIDDLNAFATDVLIAASDIAQEVVHALEQEGGGDDGDSAESTDIKVTGKAGETAKVRFIVWNDGRIGLKTVKVTTLGVVGVGEPITDITMEPASFAKLAPDNGEPVDISIVVPADAKPGEYRGLINVTDIGSATLVLKVTAPS